MGRVQRGISFVNSKPPGDSTVDAQAVTSALTAKFQPATFLCSPVISDTTYTFTFEGRDRF